jgi:hypothetical protein
MAQEARDRSPFPGMDPYLERNWSDVHVRLVAYAGDALNNGMPDDLVARSERRVSVDADDEEDESIGLASIVPDVEILDDEAGGVATASATLLASGLAPVRLNFGPRTRQRSIAIRDADGRLVTVIEFVSPGNKSVAGAEAFRRKRGQLLRADVNVVEIDLTRRGNWRRLYDEEVTAVDAAATAYRTVLFAAPGVADAGPSLWLHPMPLDAPLPEINIPLRPIDTPVGLPLQPLIDAAWRNGRYGRTIDYDKPCDPPLDANSDEPS